MIFVLSRTIFLTAFPLDRFSLCLDCKLYWDRNSISHILGKIQLILPTTIGFSENSAHARTMELGTTWQYLVLIAVKYFRMIWFGRVTSKAETSPTPCDSMDSHLHSLTSFLQTLWKCWNTSFHAKISRRGTDTVNGMDNAGCELTREWAQESWAAAPWKRILPGQTQIWSKGSVLFLPELLSFVFSQSGSQSALWKAKI